VKIVLAFDKFKGSLTAGTACAAVRRGLLLVHPGLNVILKPMADGGDGTAEVLKAALGGKWKRLRVTGPLPTNSSSVCRARCPVSFRGIAPWMGQPQTAARYLNDRHRALQQAVCARYLWIPGKKLAVIEMAAASGLALLPSRQRNPLRTTTYGTGELIADAIRRGAKRILLGVGGSATVDGGVGAAMALGWKFLDATGQSIGPGGGELERIATIIPPTHQSPLTIHVLCDVDNPLCGPQGAARTFAPQKGATPAMVTRLDAGLRHLANLVKAQLGKNIHKVPGGGAAGGLAAGALAFLDAKLVSGVDTVMDACDLAKELRHADWVITGEGCFDEQSLRGKVVSGVVKLARQRGVPVAVLAGAVRLSGKSWRRAGVSAAEAIQLPGMSTEEAMARADELLCAAAQRFAAENIS
jgi:glycerate kinase